jgi:hypothetical protein
MLLITDALAIPRFLRISQADRAKAWEKSPPKPIPNFGREVTETERLYRASIEHDRALRRAINEQRWAELKIKREVEKAERALIVVAIKRRGRR